MYGNVIKKKAKKKSKLDLSSNTLLRFKVDHVGNGTIDILKLKKKNIIHLFKNNETLI